MKKRILAALLCLCMTLALLPTTAFAVRIQAGAPTLTVTNSTTVGSTVAFAGREWCVIGDASGGVTAPAGHITLLSNGLVATNVPFRENINSETPGYTYYDLSYYANNPGELNWTDPSEYMGSTLQQAMVSYVGTLGAEGSLVSARASLDGIAGQN